MPKEAARIWLKVIDVGYERIQDITIDEIRREGLASMAVHAGNFSIAQNEFKQQWNPMVKKYDHVWEINPYIWEKNPYVWVIHFKQCERPE